MYIRGLKKRSIEIQNDSEYISSVPVLTELFIYQNQSFKYLKMPNK